MGRQAKGGSTRGCSSINSSPKICQSKCKSLRNLHFEHLLQLNDDADFVVVVVSAAGNT